MHILWLGEVEYRAAWQLQAEWAAALIAHKADEALLLLEHPPTITLGRSAKDAHLITPRHRLSELGVDIVPVDRGGDITYHYPGQLVGYPIADLNRRGRDLHAYLRTLEAALINSLTEYGIEAERKPPHTGVWIGDRKIAAMGIKVSRWVATHGFALNYASDLSGFEHIVPCGLKDFEVTSLSRELGGSDIDAERLREIVARRVTDALGASAFTRELPDGLSQESQMILAQAVDMAKSWC